MADLTYDQVVKAIAIIEEADYKAASPEEKEYLDQWKLMQNALNKAYYKWRENDRHKQFSH